MEEFPSYLLGTEFKENFNFIAFQPVTLSLKQRMNGDLFRQANVWDIPGKVNLHRLVFRDLVVYLGLPCKLAPYQYALCEDHGICRHANCDRVTSDGKNLESSMICYISADSAIVFVMNDERMIRHVLNRRKE